MKRVTPLKIALIALFVVVIAAFFYFDLGRFFTLDYIRHEQQTALALYAKHPLLFPLAFIVAFSVYISFGLFGTWMIIIGAGAIFGTLLGGVIGGLCYALGGTIQFWVARYLFKDFVARRWGKKLEQLNREIERDGNLVLFSLRLMSIIPYPTINVMMALTPIRTLPFFFVTLAANTILSTVYANTGSQIATITTWSDVINPSLFLSLCLIALFPWLVKFGLARARKAREAKAPNEL
ncbi:MAG: VTT domain-containing protein [Bdellovibrionota bacterium]